MSSDYFSDKKPVWIQDNTHAILKQIKKVSKPFMSMNVLIEKCIRSYLKENELEGI